MTSYFRHTIRNTFNAASFKNEIHEHIPTAALNSLSATSIETINETDDQLKGLDDYPENNVGYLTSGFDYFSGGFAQAVD